MKTTTKLEDKQIAKSNFTEISHMQTNLVEKPDRQPQSIGKPQSSNDNNEEVKVNNQTCSKSSLKTLKKGGMLAAYKRKLFI